jgi:RHS repeat-associated protein
VISYDTANRRTSVTLPNGVQMQYTYDNAGEVTQITYQNGGSSLGNLTYAYDADGRRVGEGGSLAEVNLPSAVASASYDASNRLTSWGSSSLTYDADGNLTNYGSSTYTWNERNQLIAASDGNSSFAYDAFGRRTTATVAGATTPYLYDGANPVLVNSAFMLSGLGMDEYYAQVSSTGTSSLPTDAIGSVIAVTNATGATTESYSYEPYGATTESGSGGTAFQYTGRENDGASNLYFFRARYYSPALGRFISEDPAGLIGGPNGYAYAGDDPINYVDPLGLCWQPTPDSGQVNECVACWLPFAGLADLAAGFLDGLFSSAAEGAAAIQTPYALEVQSASAEAQAALDAAQNGATLYRTGTLGSNMAGESQYWSLENPLTSPGYAGQMGVPGGTPNFVLQGTLNPGASVITNVAPGLGVNAGGGIQIVTSPGGVGNLIFTMPY